MKQKLADIKKKYLIDRIRDINTPVSVIKRKTTQKSVRYGRFKQHYQPRDIEYPTQQQQNTHLFLTLGTF